MKVSDLKRMIERLPDDMDVEIHNNGYEWYGLATMNRNQWKRMDDRLVLNFGGEWDDHDVNDYRNERRKQKEGCCGKRSDCK